MSTCSFDKQLKKLPFSKADELIIREFHRQFPEQPKKSALIKNHLPFGKGDAFIIKTFHKAHEREL